MRVRLITTMAGADGIRHAGQVADVSVELARDLVAGGFAEALHSFPELPEIETATLHMAVETATLSRKKRRS